MKKLGLVFCMLFLLSGCASETMETVDDVYKPEEPAQPAEIQVELPKDAAVQTMEGKTGKLYFCENCDIAVEILPAGDIDRTLCQLTGFHKDALNVMLTEKEGKKCYECVWSAVGESGDQVGRVYILDDGKFHYCISMLSDAEDGAESQKVWNQMIPTVKIK